jgi:hypothetical protein
VITVGQEAKSSTLLRAAGAAAASDDGRPVYDNTVMRRAVTARAWPAAHRARRALMA